MKIFHNDLCSFHNVILQCRADCSETTRLVIAECNSLCD
jgi:hypothetical protein